MTSNSIKYTYNKDTSVKPVLSNPLGPRFRFCISLNAGPRSLQGNVLVAPRPLPLDQFKLVWETVHQSDKDRYWKQAYVKPNRFLCNQKSLNVKATRGKVLQALENDVELQGDLKKSSIRNGEQLALSMLFIELLILNVLNPSTSCHQYIGRAQFPKFKGTPPINHNSYEDNLQIERLSYW